MKYHLLLIIILLAFSCSKEDIKPSDYDNEASNGSIIKTSEGQVSALVVSNPSHDIYVYDVDSNSVTYSTEVPVADDLIVGKVIIGNPSEKATYGFMRMITARQDGMSTITLSTREASFGEAFDQLTIDARYRFDGTKITRDATIETDILEPFTLGLGSNYSYDIIPEYGILGDFVFNFDADYINGNIKEFRVGVENFAINASATATYYGQVTGSIAKDFPLPLPFFIPVPIGEIIIPINFRLVFSPGVNVKLAGGIESKISMQNQPIDLIMDIKSNSFTTISNNPNSSIQDLNITADVINATANSRIEGSLPITIEMSPLNGFDFGNAFVKFDLLNVHANSKTEVIDDLLQLNTTFRYYPTISGGVKVDLIKKFTDKIKNFSIPLELSTELWKDSFLLGVDTFLLPCYIHFNQPTLEVVCIEDGESSEVQFHFRVNSVDGSEEGYVMKLESEELGIYKYNKDYTITRPANQVHNIFDLKLSDVDSPSCIIQWRLIDPCDLTAHCDSAPIVDIRDDQEYCYVTLADTKKWMSSNLKYSDGGSIGVCYDYEPQNCVTIGRLYSQEEAKTACPTGWRLPTVADWENMLAAHKLLYQSPGTNTYYNLFNESVESIGFNIIYAGQYHGWLSSDPKFDGSVLNSNNSNKLAMFWTSDVEFHEGNSAFEENGVAMKITSGSAIKVSTPLITGLPCRCIRE